jgi:hypothetical protein
LALGHLTPRQKPQPHEATIFTNDFAKLNPQLSADVSKTSALEINQASSIAQGIGIGVGI